MANGKWKRGMGIREGAPPGGYACFCLRRAAAARPRRAAGPSCSLARRCAAAAAQSLAILPVCEPLYLLMDTDSENSSTFILFCAPPVTIVER